MNVIDKLAPLKTKQVKDNSQEWVDGEVLESIALRERLVKRFKGSKLNIAKEVYNKACNKWYRLICKKREYFENKLKENIAKTKDFWKHFLVYPEIFQLLKQMQLKIIIVPDYGK